MKNKFYVVYSMDSDGIKHQDTYTQKKEAIRVAKLLSKTHFSGYCDQAYNPQENIEFTIRSKKYKNGKEVEHYIYGE